MIAQSAGITGILTAAGMDDGAIHHWFGSPRRELNDLSPLQMLELAPNTPGCQTMVLELARADAAAAVRDRQAIIARREADGA